MRDFTPEAIRLAWVQLWQEWREGNNYARTPEEWWEKLTPESQEAALRKAEFIVTGSPFWGPVPDKDNS